MVLLAIIKDLCERANDRRTINFYAHMIRNFQLSIFKFKDISMEKLLIKNCNFPPLFVYSDKIYFISLFFLQMYQYFLYLLYKYISQNKPIIKT